jgi:hypothetical protein
MNDMQDESPDNSPRDTDEGADEEATDSIGLSILDDMDAIGRDLEESGEADLLLTGEPERPRTELEWEGPGQLVYEPRIRQVGFDHYAVEGKCEDRNQVAWGFWGGLLAIAVALLLLSSGFATISMWDLFWAMVAIGVGVLLYRFGERSSLREEVLCEIDIPREQLIWPAGTIADDEERHVRFDEVTEIVFGMTRLPVTSSDARVRVDAFTLLVRTPAEKLIPVIEGSPYKEEVHEIGEFLGELTGKSMTYVGRGIRD